MKKFYSIALMFVVLLSAVLFSACGDKYGKLSMSFYSSAGVEINNLELLIDNNAITDNSSAEIGVKFINIETEDIGSIIAYSPSDVVTASNYRYDGDMCYFTVKANKSSLNSKIIVKHLASNKIAELSLVVNQKSNDLQIRNSNYVVSIPDGEEINTHYINSSLTYGLLPSGSTDKIYFKFAPGYTYTSLNVEPIWEEVGENQYVTGFRTTHNSTEGKVENYMDVTSSGNYVAGAGFGYLESDLLIDAPGSFSSDGYNAMDNYGSITGKTHIGGVIGYMKGNLTIDGVDIDIHGSYDEYIDAKMTATWFSDKQSGKKGKKGNEVITNELIYYWMIAYNIPKECEKWHLNRLLTLIRVCEIKNNPPKNNKMSMNEIYSQNRSILEARRKAAKAKR